MKCLKNFALILCLLPFISNAQISFIPSTTQACAPAGITFTNTSTVGAHYDWDMGDGGFYNDQTNAVHNYTSGGTFDVTLTVYSGTYAYIGETQMTITIEGPPNYMYISQNPVCPGDDVGMSVWLPNTNFFYSWDFGDGNSNGQGYDYVNHAYNNPGVYYPTVTVTTNSCGDYSYTDTIIVSNSLTDFGADAYMYLGYDTVCPNTNLYADASFGFSNYLWDFGDGNTSSEQYVDWAYSSVGNYNVSVTITNGCGVDTVITEPVVVSNSTPVQNPYMQVPDTICPNQEFYAYAGANDGIQVDWDMGDGTIVTDDSGFDHTYTGPGIYYPECTIINECGNTITLTDTVVVNPNAQITDGELYISDHTICPGDEVYMSSNSNYSYFIDYGDGNGSSTSGDYSYTTPGTYIVSSTIQNACGNSIVLYDTIYVQTNLPIDPNNVYAGFQPDPACPGSEVELYAADGYSTYVWDFGDGTDGYGQEIDHVYNAAGIYTAAVTITNGCGQQTTTSVNVDIQDNLPIDDFDFYLATDTTCLGNSIFMQSESGGNGYTFYWDLGDGTTSTNSAVVHEYLALGEYEISLTVTNGCGSDSTKIDTVHIVNNYTPSTSDVQAFVTSSGCVGDQLSFVIIPSGIGDVTWDFGDGNTSSTVEQVFVQGIANVDLVYHAYSAPGTYWAYYTLTNACGNSVTDSVEMTIGVPGANIEMDVEIIYNEYQTECQGTPIEFMVIGSGTFIWDFGDGSGQLVTYDALSPVYHTYENSGSYTVTVDGINGCGNTEDSDETVVIPPSNIEVTTNTVTEPNCGMQNGLAIVSASGGIPPYSYNWTNGDEGVIADSLESGIYVVTVEDINGCSNEGTATVSDEEGVTILVDNVVDVDCYGEDNGSISVSLLGGQPPYTILWSNGDQTEDIFGLQAGPYEIFVTDANGCFSVQTIDVEQPSKSNISVITQPASCGSTNGAATAIVNNGTPPYNYIWPNATGPSSQTGGLAPGVHTLLVIDGNTCLLEKDFSINETGAPIIISDSTETGTCNGSLSSIYISTVGGQQPFTYNWSDGSSSQDLTGVIPGEYTVEITGNNGCSSHAFYTVEESTPDQTNICMVDVDTLTGTNLVVWEPLMDPGIDSYNIYKESSEAGLYYLIGNQSADSISQYFDYLSDPQIRSWRYKVAAVDDCGNEAQFSDYHKTIHLTANMGISNDVNLIWDKYEGFSYTTYYINRYHPTTGWEIIDSVSSNVQSYTDANLPGDSSLIYMISIPTPSTCTAQKAQDYNSSRSNNGSINMPDDGSDDGSGIVENNVEVVIYPNPTDGVVQIRYEGSIALIKMYDISGKLVFENTSNNGSVHKIDMTSFERGVYNVQLFTGNGVINAKVIRE